VLYSPGVFPDEGKSILTSPHLMVLILELSAMCISYGAIKVKLIDLDWSGQEWGIAPESTIVP